MQNQQIQSILLLHRRSVPKLSLSHNKEKTALRSTSPTLILNPTKITFKFSLSNFPTFKSLFLPHLTYNKTKAIPTNPTNAAPAPILTPLSTTAPLAGVSVGLDLAIELVIAGVETEELFL